MVDIILRAQCIHNKNFQVVDSKRGHVIIGQVEMSGSQSFANSRLRIVTVEVNYLRVINNSLNCLTLELCNLQFGLSELGGLPYVMGGSLRVEEMLPDQVVFLR